MKTFDDLVFKQYSSIDSLMKAIIQFENGYGVSVLFGGLAYSNGIDTYELAVLKDGLLCYDTEITNDVIGYIEKEEVTNIMIRIQQL